MRPDQTSPSPAGAAAAIGPPATRWSSRPPRVQPSATVTRGDPAARRSQASGRPTRRRRSSARPRASDIVARLKHQQREQEAHRICLLKIRERGPRDEARASRAAVRRVAADLLLHGRGPGRLPGAGPRPRSALPHPHRDAADRRPRRSEDARRLRLVRPAALLHDLAADVRADLDQDGEAAEPEPEPVQAVGDVRQAKCCLRYELPNGKGVVHGGCADEGGCGSCDNPTGPGAAGAARAAAAAAASAADSTSAPPSSSALCLTQRSHSALQRHAAKQHPIDDGERPEISHQLRRRPWRESQESRARTSADQRGRESQVACESQRGTSPVPPRARADSRGPSSRDETWPDSRRRRTSTRCSPTKGSTIPKARALRTRAKSSIAMLTVHRSCRANTEAMRPESRHASN